MNSAFVWMLTFAFTGPNAPPGGEQAKFKTKEECLVALEQKKEQYKKAKKTKKSSKIDIESV